VPGLALDQDGDGWISDQELRAQWQQVAPLFHDGVRLTVDGEVWQPDWRLEGFEGIAPLDSGVQVWQYAVLVAERSFAAPPEAVALYADLFVERGNPEHLLHVAALGFGAGSQQYVLHRDVREVRIDVPGTGSILGAYLHLGFVHVLEGWDHLAFLLALLVGVAGVRALLGAVTAFTLAHSMTLAMAALGVWSLAPPLVEPGIALSVLLVLVWHLRRGAAGAKPWIPAFVFGLLHGFGFAGVLGDAGMPGFDRGWALAGFNLGVEGGQLAFVLPVAAAIAACRRLPAERRAQLATLALLGLCAFALHLVGTAVVSWWLRGPQFLAAPLRALPWAALAALLLAYLPGGDPQRRTATRRLLAQGLLLTACYGIGASLG
jgi:hydrogenase/urease accessory protein HupE